MDAEQFRQRTEVDQILADYLDEVAQEADPDPAHRDPTLGLGTLFVVATYALYRLTKNYLDYERGLDEAELRQLMLDQVDALVKKGWKPEKALEAVERISKDIAGLRPDSPALKAALALVKAGGAASGA